jgi:hypothetical protein
MPAVRRNNSLPKNLTHSHDILSGKDSSRRAARLSAGMSPGLPIELLVFPSVIPNTRHLKHFCYILW